MAGNTVTLTFAGDSKSLERTFDHVGSGAKRMAGNLDSAGQDAKRFGKSMDSVNDSVGKSEGKFMAGADLLDGLGGAFGLPLEGATNMARSFADLASGVSGIVGPALSGLLGRLGLTTAATTSAAGAQTGLNTAMAMNPIGIVVASLAALAAGIYVVVRNWDTIKNAFVATFNWVKSNWPLLLGIITGPIGLAVLAFTKHKDTIIGIFQDIAGAIAAPFQAAFRLIKSAWNSTLGGFGFEFGGWDPPGPGNIPGIKLKIPSMHQGGVVPGALGTEMPILAMAGERVVPRGEPADGNLTVQVVLDGRQIHESLLRLQRTSGPLGLR